jgi:tRNASer (uridine44-2'-O)-methyltransferase
MGDQHCEIQPEAQEPIQKEQETLISGLTASEILGDKFAPYEQSQAPTTTSGLPPELWTIVQSAPANFSPQYFVEVSRNLVENPNLTASHIARAEVPYQSFTDATFNPQAKTPDELASIVKHLRPECRPQLLHGGIDGYELSWTIVRKLIPRNPKLDDTLMQTCHLFTSYEDITITSTSGEQTKVEAERYMIIYIPHATSPDAIPFYHPKVQSLAILYTFLPNHDPKTSSLPSPGHLSIYYDLFPSYPLDTRLSRTALMLLQITHKHSRGRQAGYKKRVHHDQIIPQKAFWDTYAYLKGKYAKALIEGWVEQTPPEKHVFEDLGIAAFLIELWKQMYAPAAAHSTPMQSEDENIATSTHQRNTAQSAFPGFVDIGCGNGLLVYILNNEGWPGWGFDARRRKTWDTFPDTYISRLKELLLVPRILRPDQSDDASLLNAPPSHDGTFPHGTFIISNHADELTPWTPLLAYLSSSPFIAIPCCSHDLGGTRFRAQVHKEYFTNDHPSTTLIKGKQPSAYASLCSWVCHLTEAVGYKAEKEHLRIPSTRNTAVVGRKRIGEVGEGDKNGEERMAIVRGLIEKEMGGATTIEQVWRMWMRSGGDLVKKSKKSSH